MKKVALIPVFSSEKLMNKNVLMLEGKLVAGYSIEAALATKCFERIIVITDKQQYQDALNTYPIDVFSSRKTDLFSTSIIDYLATIRSKGKTK